VAALEIDPSSVAAGIGARGAAMTAVAEKIANANDAIVAYEAFMMELRSGWG